MSGNGEARTEGRRLKASNQCECVFQGSHRACSVMYSGSGSSSQCRLGSMAIVCISAMERIGSISMAKTHRNFTGSDLETDNPVDRADETMLISSFKWLEC